MREFFYFKFKVMETIGMTEKEKADKSATLQHISTVNITKPNKSIVVCDSE